MEWYDNIPCQQRNSEITTGLRIQLVQSGYSKTLLHNATSTSQEREQHTLNLTWLSPGLPYEIRIAAVNVMGQAGPYSNQFSVPLPQYKGKINIGYYVVTYI
jgi:hypothetical protein